MSDDTIKLEKRHMTALFEGRSVEIDGHEIEPPLGWTP